jgi:D-aspartate ligase
VPERSTPATPPAIVLGSGLGALGALRLLRRSGVPAYSLNVSPSFESRSRWFLRPPGVSVSLSSGADLASALASTSLARGVLIPCSDNMLSAVTRLPAQLAARFPSSTPSSTIAEQLSDKAKFAALLDSLAVPRPRTLVIEDRASLERFDAMRFECPFLKPVDSASFIRSYGVKACHVRDVADARAQLDRVQADGHRMVVQEYVPGPGSNHFLIDGFVSAPGDIRALFARRRLRMFPVDFGDSTHMVSVPLGDVEPAIRSLRQIMSAIGYRGIFSAEFKLDAHDGAFRILEINARVWIYVEFAGRCGVDVCTMAYRDALGLQIQDDPCYRSGVRLVSPYLDLAGARYAWSQGQLSKAAWLRSWLGAQQPHFNWTDPMPAITDWGDLSFRAARRLLRRRSAST